MSVRTTEGLEFGREKEKELAEYCWLMRAQARD
jgi:hypothetical protein